MRAAFHCTLIGEAHAPVCAALHRDGFSKAEQWSPDSFSSLLRTEGTIGWIALKGDLPVGLVLLRHCAGEAEILTIVVANAFRRQGVAASLLGAALGHLRNLAVEALFLEVSKQNEPALAFYLGLGFQHCGVRRAYYHDGSDAAVLRYDLTNEIR
ncbi:GNAT family N-acetyltransferase [Asaia krungthepensis]|uniref:GNAT family N-acetyltransferase n=1 Tax=Asaia krungthepensis TaxID=220990 RepID=UPI0035714806